MSSRTSACVRVAPNCLPRLRRRFRWRRGREEQGRCGRQQRHALMLVVVQHLRTHLLLDPLLQARRQRRLVVALLRPRRWICDGRIDVAATQPQPAHELRCVVRL
ncbi:hypothetical protein STCU_11066 [Strigomonas culicis]|uniref:Uncharacterized protein n=1 Tax=Strigomonas culicis TaxID=28005 RepID=S9TF54_9TRYP|nr:hypothetical protein STCU_11066 [Strigomonas culicis]|eukprot:EPY16677.1 hypothetical protein STCU_11066 [Strigomonas culicis]